MHMEVMTPSPAGGGEFNFNSASTSPYVSAPSSPQRFGNYFFSAPTSPTRAIAFHRDLEDQFSLSAATTPTNGPSSNNWKEKPGTQKTNDNQFDYETEFAFDFSGQLDNGQISLSAAELFDGGKIKPLKPQLSLQNTELRARESPKSTSVQNMKNIDEANESSSSKQRSSVNSSSSSGSIWYRKWKLKDLLLFRSASEGDKEKYGMLNSKKSENEDHGKNWSFRSTDSGGGGGGSVSSRRLGKGQVSAHEWHYTVNKAAAEEMKRKTFLPYKRGLLGCLGFTIPGVHQLSARGFSFSRDP